MEEAAEMIALDAAFGQVRAHVRAVGIERDDLAVLAAIDGKVAAEQAHCLYRAAADFIRGA
jgi:hypothetical protein